MVSGRPNFGLKTKIIGLLSIILLVLLIVDIAWTYQSQKRATEAVLLEESRVLVTEMTAVWDFISINQDTINHTLDGRYEYKGLHCAIAGKSVAALFSQNSDYTIRFANIEPRNIRNNPDEYETQALHRFTENTANTEYFSLEDHEGESAFRYVSAMKATEYCIECHGEPAGELDPTGYQKEGWETGDIAGAVSVIIPTELYFSNMRDTVANNVLFFLAIMLCMAIIIYLALTRLITNPLESLRHSFAEMAAGVPTSSQVLSEKTVARYSSREIDALFLQFDTMAKSLLSLYTNLESVVDERTLQLSEANVELQMQRKHVENVNAKLKCENQYKSDFLAIVSHELRTPLTSIIAFTDLMADNVPVDDSLVCRQLDEIDKNGRILLEMVDNVLETARIQAGSERLNLELVDLSDIVGMVEASSAPLAAKKGIVLSTHVAADVPLIFSDWEKIRRIFVNLVSNAIKFTGDGGSVCVRACYDQAKDAVVIEVADNGIGIPLDKQGLIFERFTQENMSTVRRYGGSGLGLSLVKDLAAMLGGSIFLDSQPGEGSTFSVVLPANRQTEGANDEDNVD